MFLLSLPTVLCPFHVVYLLCSPCDFVILLDNAPPTDPLLLREWPREIRSELNFVMENYTFSGYFPTTSSSSNIASVCNSGNQFRQRQNRQRQRRVLVLTPPDHFPDKFLWIFSWPNEFFVLSGCLPTSHRSHRHHEYLSWSDRMPHQRDHYPSPNYNTAAHHGGVDFLRKRRALVHLCCHYLGVLCSTIRIPCELRNPGGVFSQLRAEGTCIK